MDVRGWRCWECVAARWCIDSVERPFRPRAKPDAGIEFPMSGVLAFGDWMVYPSVSFEGQATLGPIQNDASS